MDFEKFDYFNYLNYSNENEYSDLINKFEEYKKEHIFSVNEINSFIQKLIENEILQNISIKGEISNISKSSTGNIFFSLKDETKSLLKCIIFKYQLSNIKFDFKDGDKVICTGDIKVYKQNSEFNLKVKSIRKEGIGELYQKFLELKDKLEKEGLFDSSKKKKIPKYPFNIGVITAETGAVVNDIVKTLKRRAPFINIYIFPCQVQGNEASTSIANAIKIANNFSETCKKIDILVLARGGGSIEDLWPFNEEIVAREIFYSKIPTISAIGHETDFSISDFVADLRASTPTAAAEIISNEFTIIKELLKESSYTLMKDLLKILNYKKSKIDIFKNIQYMNNLISKKLDNLSYDILIYDQNINNFFFKKIDTLKNKLYNYESILNALSPKNVLKRGFTLIKKDNKYITTYKDLNINDNINIEFFDGEKEAKITK
jgi:exodeoxyribonuclease VII large subunit